jgi:antitoxin VapB
VALNIRNAEADRLAAEVASLTGETKTLAVIVALKERRQRLQQQGQAASKVQASLVNQLDQIGLRCAARAIRDSRTADAILGYDATGLPS